MLNNSPSINLECLTEDESTKKTEGTKEKASFLSRKRKRKCETTGRHFVCDKCGIAYLSYPALYTHNRNKHSMIPITSKKRFFQSAQISKTKFKYSKPETIVSIKQQIVDLIEAYKETFEQFYKNPQSLFYRESADIAEDTISKQLKNIHSLPLSAIEEFNSTGCSIEEVIVMYMVMMAKITSDGPMVKLISLFGFLLKEYLDCFGWHYDAEMVRMGIREEVRRISSYSECFTCEDLPDVMNDFVAHFLLVEPSIERYQTELMDICHNFCLWLYSSKMSSFHLIRVG